MIGAAAEAEIVVLGAGPAGTLAAALLHRAGARVAILEPAAFPRFAIGESLLPRCMDHLAAAGLLAAAEACAFQPKHGVVFWRGDHAARYDFAHAHTHGATATWQVQRARFDQALAEACAAMGVAVLHGLRAAAFEPGLDPALVVEGPGGARTALRPRFVVDATGSAAVLPRLLGLDAPGAGPGRAAVFGHVQADPGRPDDPRAAGDIWVVEEAGTWLWLIPFADGTISVGAVGAPGQLDALGPTPEDALRAALAAAPSARARLGADVTFVRAAARLDHFGRASTALYGPGFCLVGNATAFLDPVFSSGVALAFESAALAAPLALRAARGEAPDWEAAYAAPLRQRLAVFGAFVDAWYSGALSPVLHAATRQEAIGRQITSVLAGYVHDEQNPFVRLPAARIARLRALVA